MLRATLISALMIATPVAAQTPQSTAAATQLVDLMTPPAQSKAAVDQQIRGLREGQMVRAMLGQSPQFRTESAKNQPAFNAAIGRMGAIQAQALGPIFSEMQSSSRRIAIENYARTFSAAELQQIITFYRSPVGAKLMQQQPQVAAAISKQVQSQYAPRLDAAQKSIAPKLDAELKKLFPQGATKK